ncbi:hypothetical protein HDU93_001921 [Gonapodya sp. JEL0774]|nr:hypothetical protein HDU93_001921 [Gonapodya sp. JEL0774]
MVMLVSQFSSNLSLPTLPLSLVLLFFTNIANAQSSSSKTVTSSSTSSTTSVPLLNIEPAPVRNAPPTVVPDAASSPSSGPNTTVIFASVGSVLAALLIAIGFLMYHKRKTAKRLRLAAEARGHHPPSEFQYDREVWEDDYRVDPSFWQPVISDGTKDIAVTAYTRLIGLHLANTLESYTFPDGLQPELVVAIDFAPAEPNELHLNRGDTVRLESCSRDGQAVGQSLASGEIGVFPLSILTISATVVSSPSPTPASPVLPHGFSEQSLPSTPTSSSPASKMWSKLVIGRWGKKAAAEAGGGEGSGMV